MRQSVLFVAFSIAAPLLAQGNIASLSPSTASVGGPAFTLTVNGTGFSAVNIVQWDSGNVPTSFVTSNQLTATIPASFIAATGAHNVRVKASTLVPFFSNTVSFDVVNPVPTLTSISPPSVLVGSSAITLTCSGSSFVPSSVVLWNGTQLSTTFGSSSSLTATVPSQLLTTAGVRNVTVFNPIPGGGLTPPLLFAINHHQPTLTGVLPGVAMVGSGPVTVTYSGSGFDQSTIARLDGVDLATTFVDASHVQGVVPASMLVAPGSLVVSVFNPAPGGGTASLGVFTVANTNPTLTSISPSSTTAGVNVTLTAVGTNFNATSIVRLNGVGVSTATVSPTQLAAAVTGTEIPVGATVAVTVQNVGGGIHVSSSVPLNVFNPVPLISSLNLPAGGFTPGGSDQTFAPTGTGFTPVTAWTASGVPLASTFLSPTQMTVTMPAFLLRETANYQMRASNPAPGGAASFVTAIVAGPIISTCTPGVVPVFALGSQPVALTVHGTATGPFAPGDTIRIDGVPRPTTFQDATTLGCSIDAGVPGALQPGGFAVTVTRQGAVGPMVSNAVGVTVGIPGSPDNEGTITLVPAPPAPGTVFNVRVEIPVAIAPLTLIAQSPAPSPVVLGFGAGFELAIGPGLGTPIVLADGLGLFGPPTPTSSIPHNLLSFNVIWNQGVFNIHGLVAPPVALGITFSMVAVYPTPLSPFGLSTTHVSGAYSL